MPKSRTRIQWGLIGGIGAVIWLSSSAAYAESEIRKSCRNTRETEVVYTQKPSQLNDGICELRQSYADDSAVRDAVTRTINVLHKLPKDSAKDGSWQGDRDLNNALTNLTKALNASSNQKAAEQMPSNKQAKRLQKFILKWSDPKSRSQARLKEYATELQEVMGLTKTGRQILACFKNSKGPKISGERFRSVDELPEHKGSATMFFYKLDTDPNRPGKYIKSIYLNLHSDPVNAVSTLAHEMKHGCRSNELITLQEESLLARDQYDSLAAKDRTLISITSDGANTSVSKWAPKTLAALNRLKLVRKKSQQFLALDEVRAYRAQSDFFKELSAIAPELVCDRYYVGSLFGKTAISVAEYNALIDESFQRGRFPAWIIYQYVDTLKAYQSENVFDIDDKGNVRLLPELKNAIMKEGFKVE